MTRPRTRLREHHRPASRRSGPTPGRRLASALALIALAQGAFAATAVADQSVVSATIYTSSGGGVATPPPVTLSTLGGCPAYDGSNPMYSYPGGQPFQATTSSWTVSTVLSCGLQLPLSDVTDVQVSSPTEGFENPLSAADLSVPSPFQDPDSQPVISYDGNEDLITYFRPWRGGSDQNGRDGFTQSSPIAIVVYENGPPLSVSATAQTISKTGTTMTDRFTATVRGSSENPIPASALTWNWSFGDGSSSGAPAPEHAFKPGVYPVTVQVSDPGAGTGGTDTIDVTFSTGGDTGATGQSGAGTSPRARSSTGVEHGGGRTTGGTAGGSGSRPAASHANRSSSSGGTPVAHATTGTETSAKPSTPVAPKPVARATRSTRQSTPRHRPAAATNATPNSPLVVGRLVSDVTPLPVVSSPLVRLVSAPLASAMAVRRAIRASSLPVLAGCLVVALLLGLGAARELRWRRIPA